VNAGSAPVRVVIADDDEPFLEFLRALIDAQPELVVVGSARDGIEALELAEEMHPEAIILDLHMPRLDGVSAIARLRRDFPNLCVIVLTGDPAPPLHQAAREAGADGVFQKGEMLEQLLERLSRGQPAG
jgi:DNA-binding NarL/FixJ family response regulator